MSNRIHGSGNHRFVYFSTRPVFMAKLRPDAHKRWSEIFSDCECESQRYVDFFADREGKEFDVYSWDISPNESTEFFDVDDSDIVLPFALFDTFEPDFRSA